MQEQSNFLKTDIEKMSPIDSSNYTQNVIFKIYMLAVIVILSIPLKSTCVYVHVQFVCSNSLKLGGLQTRVNITL